MSQLKEERNQSKFSPQDPKSEREKRLLSTQLISQENPATKINHFEGNVLEWLVPGGTPFKTEDRILREREGKNLLVHACQTNSLFFLFFFSFFLCFHFSSYFYFFLFLSCYSLFLFPDFQVFNPLLFLSSLFLFLYTTRASFYSACRDWILLFQPLTTFVWSGCTCRPLLDRLCATLRHQTKRTILFISLPWHTFFATVWVSSLSLSLMACTQWLQLSFASLGGVSSQQDTSLKRTLVLKIGLPLSPPPNHALFPLTHDLIASCIGWGTS